MPTLGDLSASDRERLMKFVCTFVWADLQVTEAEREFVGRLMNRLELDPEERAQVVAWLKMPPAEVDPTEVPAEHRELFVSTLNDAVLADDQVTEDELETLKLFKQLAP